MNECASRDVTLRSLFPIGFFFFEFPLAERVGGVGWFRTWFWRRVRRGSNGWLEGREGGREGGRWNGKVWMSGGAASVVAVLGGEALECEKE